jgi:hypothetical protein
MFQGRLGAKLKVAAEPVCLVGRTGAAIDVKCVARAGRDGTFPS